MRALIDADDREAAEACADLNMQTWVAALESAVMLETGRPFQVARLPGRHTFVTALGRGSPDTPAPIISFEMVPAPAVDYQRVAYGFSAWGSELRHHLFYFRRLLDENLLLDVRWLNGYRLLEWHFAGNRANLPRQSACHAFVARFPDVVAAARPGQNAVGFIEEAGALAAHAGLDARKRRGAATRPT